MNYYTRSKGLFYNKDKKKDLAKALICIVIGLTIGACIGAYLSVMTLPINSPPDTVYIRSQ